MNARYAPLFGALLLSLYSPQYAIAATSFALEVHQNKFTVKGHVTNREGEPLVGATILVVGTKKTTITDNSGNFELQVPAKTPLRIFFLGYKTIDATASDGMEITMTENNALLDEVVVVGYGKQKKVNLTGAVSTVDLDKTLTSRPEQDLSKALQGAVPGLSIVNSSGDISSQPTIRIRGLGTLSNGQTSSPLIVVDGVPVDDMSMINMNDVASISVLKDAASTSIYGSRAAFGVILITTKQAKQGDKISVKYSTRFAWDQATILPDFPDVPTQLSAAIQAKARKGDGAVELFGMYFDKLLPYAEKWKEQNSGSYSKRGR